MFERDRQVGELKIKLPKPPHKNKIDNYDLSQGKQMFYIPDQKVVADVDRELKSEDPSLTEEQKEFVKEEWRRRIEGYWFYNNGNIEYVTGLHYFYLTAWKIPIQKEEKQPDGRTIIRKRTWYPDWTDSDRDYFYFWSECYIDPLCGGMIHVTNRRDGKTHRANATNYEIVSRTKDAKSAIQSKTNDDGKQVFKKLVRSWQRLPEYYKPVDVGESFPQSILRFDEPAKRTTKSQIKDYSDVLRSEIYFTNAKEEALDGEDLIFSFQDEIGKTKPKEADVAERIAVVLETIADGTSITGKLLATTTVEEMEKKGGKECKRIWDNSDINQKNELGQTNSRLYRYFKPADYGLRGKDENGVPFMDKHGYTDKERARAYLMKRRENLSPKYLAAEIRKYPLNEQEAFYLDSRSDVFPSQNIYVQLNYNTTLMPGTIRRGNFIWNDDEKTQVKFMENIDGRWLISWELPENMRNESTPGRNGIIPVHTDISGAGTDPFDHRTTVDNRKSNAASYVFKGYDLLNRHLSNRFVCEYIARPDVPEIFYDDMAKQCVYYSNRMLIENQKPGLINYMRTNGFYNYVMKTRQGDYTKSNSTKQVDGISLSGDNARESLINKLLTYVYHNVGYIDEETQEKLGFAKITPKMHGFCYFDHLLTDWLNFDITKWTDYDATVASGLSILAVDPVRKTIKVEKRTDVKKLFPMYSIRGNISMKK